MVKNLLKLDVKWGITINGQPKNLVHDRNAAGELSAENRK
jgi:hypothetical protein